MRFQDNGCSCFTFHFIKRKSTEDFATIFPVELVFKYHNMHQQLERDGSLFNSPSILDGCDLAAAVESTIGTSWQRPCYAKTCLPIES
jgi:hypothetical protein